MSKRILMVDDDKKIVERRSKLLRDRGHEVVCAFNGRQGLKIIKKDSNFDLLILDLDMPKMRGDELLEIIKNDPYCSSLRVLIITGVDEPYFNKNDTWEYDHNPLTVARKLGPTQRGWDEKFNIVKKWHTMDMFTYELKLKARAKGLKFQPFDELTDRKFLEAVEEMFVEPEEIDRPRKEGEPWRILIAEDDSRAREQMKKRLEVNTNYEVYTAKDGQIALEILGKDPIDLIVLDLEMPRARGDEVLSVLGSNFILRNIPVIVYTGMEDWNKPEDESLRKRVKKIGIAGATYEKKKANVVSRILKLDNVSMLLDKVGQLLEERKKWGHGYLKEPLTFFKNKNGHWMPGALEYYQPVDPYYYRYREMKSFVCKYCQGEKTKGDNFKETYEYNRSRLFPSERFNITTSESVLICPECAKSLKQEALNLGKYAGKYYKEARKEKEQKEEAKKQLKKQPKEPMNQEIFEKVKIIIAKDCFKVFFDDIKPESKLEDLFKDFYDHFMTNVKIHIEMEFDINVSNNDVDWFDTVHDIVDFIEEEIAKPKKSDEDEDDV